MLGAMISEDLKRRLRKRLRPQLIPNKLSPDQIAALLERAAYGEPYAKIGADFDVSPATVRYHVAKACK